MGVVRTGVQPGFDTNEYLMCEAQGAVAPCSIESQMVQSTILTPALNACINGTVAFQIDYSLVQWTHPSLPQ